MSVDLTTKQIINIGKIMEKERRLKRIKECNKRIKKVKNWRIKEK